jgi:hypothetical protein
MCSRIDSEFTDGGNDFDFVFHGFDFVFGIINQGFLKNVTYFGETFPLKAEFVRK